MTKRLLDLFVGTVMLIPFLPILIVVAAILKCTGERQIFYVQPRIGKGGNPFGLIKFVTMVANSENKGTKDVTLKNDPRVLPFGRFLRKTKINEMTQLFNVLKGDMSIVGWRPLLEAGFRRYSEDIQQELIKIKPGLTGIGSIVFRDEENILEHMGDKLPDQCYRDDIMPYKGALETWYIRNQTFWLDLKIILATAIAVLFPSSQVHLKMFPGLPLPDETSAVAQYRKLQLHNSAS